MDSILRFAKHFLACTYDDLPPEVVEVTKKEVLDLLGVSLRGFSAPGVGELHELVVDWGGKRESSILFGPHKVPSPLAAQMNATMGHALDYDDVHDPAVMHPGVVAIPTALAVAERKGTVTGKEFIAAVALGVDMMCRMGLAAKPGYDPSGSSEANYQAARVKQGWHLTTVTGHFAAAGVAGRLLGLDEARLVHAFGIAYHPCGGNLQCRTDGSHTKRLGPGFAAKAGITGALLARKGVTGARESLEGEHGFYNLLFRGGYDRETLTGGLGRHFEGVNVSIKPYPCCRGIHPSIDAALALRSTHGIRPADIREIVVHADEGGHQALCEPLAARIRPRSFVDAQFSIPWGVAAALAEGRVGLEHYTEAGIRNPAVLDLTAKMRVELDHSLDRADAIPPAKLTIVLKDGRTHSLQVDDPTGSPTKPMSYEQCAAKFRDCASTASIQVPDGNGEAIIALVRDLERVADIRELLRLLTAGGTDVAG